MSQVVSSYATVKKSLFHHREADAYHDHVTLKDQAVVRTTNYAECHLDYALRLTFSGGSSVVEMQLSPVQV